MKKNTKSFGSQSIILCAIALVAVIGLLMAACKEPDATPVVENPTTKSIKWTANGDTDTYELSMTALASRAAYSKNKFTYLLSVTGSKTGYSVGIVTVIFGNQYMFESDPYIFLSSNTFSLTINGTNVKTDGTQTINLVGTDGYYMGQYIDLPPLDTNGTIPSKTSNPFIGTWSGVNLYTGSPVKVIANSNLTWAATSTYLGRVYNYSGTYAYIGQQAIIYESGSLFGYAGIVSGKMETRTREGGDIIFSK